MELCDKAIQICYKYTPFQCKGCILKNLCKEYNENFKNIDQREKVIIKINEFIKHT